MDKEKFILQMFRKHRNDALRSLDLSWARQHFPNADDETLLISLHKARYVCTDIEPHMRHASAEWLRARNLHDLYGLDLLPPGELPHGAKE